MYSYNSEYGNSHLVYKNNNIVVNIVSNQYSSEEILKVRKIINYMSKVTQINSYLGPVTFCKANFDYDF